VVSRAQISRALDQPLLGYGVRSGMLNGLKDGGWVGKPIADAADNKRLQGTRWNTLALAFGFRRSLQQ